MTLPKSTELNWQWEVIQRWLNTPGIPPDARDGLLAMQREVKEEMETLEQSLHCSASRPRAASRTFPSPRPRNLPVKQAFRR
jgi:hypothetical protein